MREKGTTLLGAQQYQQALTVYAFQQGQSIAIKYQLLLLPTVVLGEKVKKKNGAKDFGAFGWMSSIIYIYPPPAFPLYIPGSFSQSTHRTVDTHIVIYCFSCCYLSPLPLLLYTRIVISLPPISPCTTCILANEARLLPSVWLWTVSDVTRRSPEKPYHRHLYSPPFQLFFFCWSRWCTRSFSSAHHS